MNRRSRFKLHSCQKKMFTVFIKSLNIWFWTECCQTKSQKLWVRLDYFFFLHLDEFRAENMKMITYCCVFFAFSCPHCPAAVTLSLNTPFCFDFSFKTPAVNKIHWDFFSSFSSIPDLSFPRPRSGQYLSFQRLFTVILWRFRVAGRTSCALALGLGDTCHTSDLPHLNTPNGKTSTKTGPFQVQGRGF